MFSRSAKFSPSANRPRKMPQKRQQPKPQRTLLKKQKPQQKKQRPKRPPPHNISTTQSSVLSFLEKKGEQPMRRCLALLFLCLLALPLSASANSHEWKIKGSSYQMDIVLMERVWARLVKEMNIPVGIEPPPMIFDSSYPSDVNMAFVYSIMPEYIVPSHIAVSPRAINKKNLSADHFIWGIGHELTHFAFVMRDNGWKYAPYYVEKTKHHHCNREF